MFTKFTIVFVTILLYCGEITFLKENVFPRFDMRNRYHQMAYLTFNCMAAFIAFCFGVMLTNSVY